MMYLITAMVVLTGFASLGVDFGRVQLARSELQAAVDAAARAAAVGLTTSSTQAKTDAIAVAAQNTVDGSPLVLTNADIAVGNWSGGVFTSDATPLNAVRIVASRTSAKGNAVPLLFASVVGRSTCNINASAIATATAGQPSGFIGLSSINVKKNAFFASYDSDSSTSPSHSHYQSNCTVGSNGTIDASGNSNDIYGNVLLGPSGSVDDFDLHGTTSIRSSNIEKPTSPAWAPGTNPGGISQNYTVNSARTLSAGTYWFSSLTINATLQFSGPSTLYINGDVDINGDLKPTSKIPSELIIYQIGNRSFGDSGSNNVDIYAVISAPDSDFTVKNNLNFYGSAIFDTITAKNNADFYYDESSTSAITTGGTSVSLTH